MTEFVSQEKTKADFENEVSKMAVANGPNPFYINPDGQAQDVAYCDIPEGN